MLYTISQLPSWKKANAGLIRMYDDEVLTKYPIIQHIHFGSIFTLRPHIESQTQKQTQTLRPTPATGRNPG
jgi:serine/threonine-protein phosphatase 2A activator